MNYGTQMSNYQMGETHLPSSTLPLKNCQVTHLWPPSLSLLTLGFRQLLHLLQTPQQPQILMLETVDRPITPLLHQPPTLPEQPQVASCAGKTSTYLSATQQHWSRLERKLKRGKQKQKQKTPVH
ncbi:glycogen synthase kinase 3 beta, isoform CRA_a, partial [Rattus norvegicus]